MWWCIKAQSVPWGFKAGDFLTIKEPLKGYARFWKNWKITYAETWVTIFAKVIIKLVWMRLRSKYRTDTKIYRNNMKMICLPPKGRTMPHHFINHWSSLFLSFLTLTQKWWTYIAMGCTCCCLLCQLQQLDESLMILSLFPPKIHHQ
jgi:hypothetical protein